VVARSSHGPPTLPDTDDAGREAIDQDIERKIARAVEFAEQSPWPEPEELFSNVYAD